MKPGDRDEWRIFQNGVMNEEQVQNGVTNEKFVKK